ncbi:MAG: hypothetical protein IT289_00605 [Oligoflexia bacterium]|nr:hypothetical protein [Oligoflexia bacterium]
MILFLNTYIVFLCLVPPIRVFNKTIFFSELLLLPLIALAIVNHSKIRLPKSLGAVWLCLTASFLAGLWRGDLGVTISQYPMGDDSFRLGQDSIRYVRWLLLFSTPWLVYSIGAKIPFEPLFKTLRLSLAASALIAVFEALKLFDPTKIYGHASVLGWADRVQGPFASPLEASLMFSVGILLGVEGLLTKKNLILNLILAACSLFALVKSQGGTAFVAVSVAAAYLMFKLPTPHRSSPSRRQVLYIFLGLGAILAVVLAWLPPWIYEQKLANFLIRFSTWGKFLTLCLEKPYVGLVGLGFTGVVGDNSLFLMSIYGGLALLIAAAIWITGLMRNLNTPLLRSLGVLWVLSFFTLDSIGYWGLGRLMWFLLGVAGLASLSRQSSQNR